MTECGGYRLVRRLGSGPRAEVWLGRADAAPVGTADARPRLVAVKVFRATTSPDSIEAELAALGRTRSRHLLRLMDVATDAAGRACLIVPCLLSGSLPQLFAARQSIMPGEAVTLLVPMARAVHQLHRAGIVHGQLAAASVLFDSIGVPVLTGFGAAGFVGDQDAGSTPAQRAADPRVAAELARLRAVAEAVLLRVEGGAGTATDLNLGAARLGEWLRATTLGESFTAELEDQLFGWASPAPLLIPAPGRELATSEGPVRSLVAAEGSAGAAGQALRAARSAAVLSSPHIAEPSAGLAPAPVPAAPAPVPAALAVWLLPEWLEQALASLTQRCRGLLEQAWPRRAHTIDRRADDTVGGHPRDDDDDAGPATLLAWARALAASIRRPYRVVLGVLLVGVVVTAVGLPLLDSPATSTAADSGGAAAGPSTGPGSLAGDASGGPTEPTVQAAKDAEAAIVGDDPLAAAHALVARRNACLMELSVLCLDGADQQNSAAWDADQHAVRAAQEGGAPPVLLPQPGADGIWVIDRMGDTVLLRLAVGQPAAGMEAGTDAGAGPETPTASILIIRTEAGWRIRDVLDD